MAAEIINDKSLWDRFVEESPHGMLFHRWDFLKIIEKHTGYGLRTYGLYEGKELIGIFPMFYKKTMGVKLVYSPPQGTLAYIPYMGLVMSPAYDGFKQRKKESSLAAAWRDIGRELKKLSPNYTSITFVRQMSDTRLFAWDGYDVEVLYTYLIDLRKPVEDLWNSLDKDCRSTIKKGAQYGFSIKNTGDVDRFSDIMAEGLKDQGDTFFQRQSPDYLKDLMVAFPDNLQMNFLYMDNEVRGQLLSCKYKDTYLGWCGGTTINRDIPTKEYFEWETIKAAKTSGYKWYENWGGDMRRLNMFKSKFGPDLVQYYHIRKKDAIGRLSDWGYGMISGRPYLSFIKKVIA